jgi:hypothetical protein
VASTFKRVNSVLVDPVFSQVTDAYPDPLFSSTYAANVAQELNTTASTSVCYRGFPIARSVSTGKLVPINVASNTANAVYEGVLVGDLTAYVVGRNTKIAVAKRGRVRSYAGGTIVPGGPVKADTAAAFSGFVAWVSGTDGAHLLAGYAYPIADGSDGNPPATTIAQGDQIFVDLK